MLLGTAYAFFAVSLTALIALFLPSSFRWVIASALISFNLWGTRRNSGLCRDQTAEATTPDPEKNVGSPKGRQELVGKWRQSSMSEPSYELQLKASENRKELQSSVHELQHRIFRSEAKTIFLICGVLALITTGGYAILKMFVRSHRRRVPKSHCAY